MQASTRMAHFTGVFGLGCALALTAAAQSATTTITEAPGSYSRDTTVTRANGKSTTYHDDRSWGNGTVASPQLSDLLRPGRL